MKDTTKNKIKNAGLIGGSIAGACASTYACACLTAVCPPVGIAAFIGKYAIGSLIAERVASHVYDVTGQIVDSAELVQKEVEDVKEQIKNMKESSQEEEA